MNLETEICTRLEAIFKGLLPGVEIFGNWLADAEMKGAEPYSATRLDVTVGGRRYAGYASPVTETTVALDLSLSADADVTLEATLAAHEKIAARLEEWQRSLAAVKRDLALDGYEPVGLRVDDAGTLSLDGETKTRHLTQQFTMKGVGK